MPLYDYECGECGDFSEVFATVEERPESIECPNCGMECWPVISLGHGGFMKQEATWLPSVLDVVDRSNPSPHVQEFVNHPNRRNYENWLKCEGLRPFEPGEEAKRTENIEMQRQRVRHEIWEKHRARKAVQL